MRRWFVAFLAFFVAVQMSWAGAALCCVSELAGDAGKTLVVSEQAHTSKAGDPHPVCETGHCHCHHAGCATPLADSPALHTPQALALAPDQTVRLKSHIPSGLERPNWLRA